MKNPKSLIIKIALGVAAVAFLFSVVTLIRNIVIGSMIFVSVLQLIGAGVIVVICFAMFRIFTGMDEEEAEENEVEEEEKQEIPQAAEPFPDDFGIDDFTSNNFPEPLPDSVGDGYDLNLFNE